ncbi:terpene synthase family protein [Streptomyces hoynatensis]|uniref:Terpene synthase n=1 Tax=Streptomyces hoynatensis TaxID=1141874 RepID=A0A3A9YMF9_9ACTN|nr:terpene synthase family protein [Streptomyces hoynatensis]RKN37528.1 hypothetical protein D7294_27710 [Streptomyces hoynatensis]
MPIPGGPLHPRSAELEAQAYDWALRRGLVDAEGHRRLAASRVVTLATSYYLTARYREMAVLARWYVWLLTLDDWYDEAPPAGAGRGGAGAHRDAAGPGSAGRGPGSAGRGPGAAAFRAALAEDLWPATRARMSPAWRARFGRHLRECVAGYRWQAAVRTGRVPPPEPAEYIAWRRRSFGAYPIFDLIEFVERQEFGAPLRQDAAAAELVAAASDAMAWTNDLHSLERDLACGERGNLALVVAAATGGGRDEAAARVEEMIAERLRALLRARAALLPLGPQGRLLGDRVCAAVRGAWDWHRASARYRPGPRAPHAGGVVSRAAR